MPPGSKLCIRNVPCRKTSQSGWKQSSSCMQACGMGKLPTAQKRCHHGLGAAEETTENVVMWRRISKLGHQHESRDIHVLKTPFFETVKETLSLTDCQQVPFEFTFVWQELNQNQRCLRFCHGTSIKVPLPHVSLFKDTSHSMRIQVTLGLLLQMLHDGSDAADFFASSRLMLLSWRTWVYN